MTKRNADELLVSPTSNQVIVKKMDKKASPTKDDGQLKCKLDTIVEEVEGSAPSWFVKAFHHLTGELNIIKDKLDDKIDNVKQEMASEVKKLEDKITCLTTEKEEQGKTIQKLQSEITKLESYTRRENLLIDGISEAPNEDIKAKVIDFFQDTLKIPNCNSIQLSRVHRLGIPNQITPRRSTRPRTIIVRFHYNPDREAVWKASWNLKDKGIYVSEDYPDSVKYNRKILLPCLKAAKRDPNVKRYHLRGDTLILDGTKYSVNDIDKLPLKLRWTVKGEKYIPQLDSTFFFGGDCYLSNFHPAPLKEGASTYSCSEQYYLHKMSLFFDDEHTAAAIMRSIDPGKMKYLSYRIKGLDESKWLPHAKSTMEKASYLKFVQNPDLQQKLLASRGSLVEANRSDIFFSCGLSLSDPNILDKSKWLGDNQLRKILEQLRQTLQ